MHNLIISQKPRLVMLGRIFFPFILIILGMDHPTKNDTSSPAMAHPPRHDT